MSSSRVRWPRHPLARAGQSTVEYLLVIAVLVVAIVAAAAVFNDTWIPAAQQFSENRQSVLTSSDLANTSPSP